MVPAVLRTLAAATAAVAALTTATPASATTPTVTTAYELPGDRVYPEGIAADPRSDDVYAASWQDGTVYRMAPGHRVAERFLPAGADGRHTANGLKVDRAGRLWVTDSTTGVAVYDTRTRRLLARFDVPEPDRATFVNDVALTPDGTAYLTDSTRAVVYRVTPAQLAHARTHGGRGTLTPRYDLGGEATALNGIAAAPSGRYLLTVDMESGALFRLDAASDTARPVTLRGGDLRQGDGLELRGRTLWAVHNRAHALSRWHLGDDGRTARQERRITDRRLALPTTLVRERGELLVVRSQFDKGGPMGPGTPETPFSVAAVKGL
ncbi:SMP-30/gluconolactonase/LRE family protein [Streptomyces sp. NPDC048172]|uniref:SMP-30/gluconolactonase/LRE family protein n=1 Tax=Streptomyces sp. NPDC048172 TaxID=3365505 RepID=UPI00371E5692